MPLSLGTSKAAFSRNVSAEMKAGKPQKQAVAIAYSQQAKGQKLKHHYKSHRPGQRTDVDL